MLRTRRTILREDQQKLTFTATSCPVRRGAVQPRFTVMVM